MIHGSDLKNGEVETGMGSNPTQKGRFIED